MRIRTAILIAIDILAMGAVGLPATARADQNDPRLTALFERLTVTDSRGEALDIDAKIWEIWDQTGDPALDALLADGIAATERGAFLTALHDFDTVIARRPDFAEGWNKRAALYFYVGQYESARADIAMTLKLEPRHMCALAGLGLVEMKLGHFEEAADAYRRVLAIDPQNASAKALFEMADNIVQRTSI